MSQTIPETPPDIASRALGGDADADLIAKAKVLEGSWRYAVLSKEFVQGSELAGAAVRERVTAARASMVEAARKLIAEEDAAAGEPWTPPSVDEIVGAVAAYFHTHGGSTAGALNPLTSASGPPVFAAGVDVRRVVEAVLSAVRGPGAAA